MRYVSLSLCVCVCVCVSYVSINIHKTLTDSNAIAHVAAAERGSSGLLVNGVPVVGLWPPLLPLGMRPIAVVVASQNAAAVGRPPPLPPLGPSGRFADIRRQLGATSSRVVVVVAAVGDCWCFHLCLDVVADWQLGPDSSVAAADYGL